MSVPCFRLTVVLAKYPASEGSTTYRWSQRPLADPGAFSEGRLLNIGDVTRSCTDQDGNYEVSRLTVELSDGDGLFRDLLDTPASQVWTGREAVLELLSEAGRAASLEWRPVFRGVVSSVQLRPGHRAALEITDLIGSKFSNFDLERVLSLKLGAEHSRLPKESQGRMYPIIVGEHSDEDAHDALGLDARKGMLPVIDTGDYNLDDPTAEPTFLPPPINVWAGNHGASGDQTYTYCITTGSAFGESTKSAVVTVSGAVKPADRGADDYVEIGWDAVPGATFYRVWGRTTTNRWLDGMNNGATYVDPETYYRDDDDQDVEKNGPDVTVNTAGEGAWGRLVVSLGATDVHDLFWANIEDGAPKKRVIAAAALDGIEFLIPTSADWPHGTPYLDLVNPETGEVIRQTVVYVRGPRLKAHREGSVTIAVNGCGMEAVGDGSGVMVDEAFKAGQLFINEHILKNNGTGYRTGPYGPLETFANGDAQLWTSQWAAAQALTVDRIGGRGYLVAWAIVEEMTVREWLRRYCVTVDGRIAASHHGQIYPVLVDDMSGLTDGHLYREREEGVDLTDQAFNHAELENRITFSYDFDTDAGKYRYTDQVIFDPVSIAANVPGGIVGDATTPKGTYHGSVQELFCTRDTATAQDSRARRLARNKRVPRYLTIDQNLIGVGDDLGAQIRVTHRDGIGVDGDLLTACCVLKHTVRSWGTVGTQLVVLDVLRINGSAFGALEDETTMAGNLDDEASLALELR